MTNRTPTDSDALANARGICGHVDGERGLQRVCIRDPHPDQPEQHNMKLATPDLARSLRKRGKLNGDQAERFTPAGPVVSPLAEATDDTDPTLVTGNAEVHADETDMSLAELKQRWEQAQSTREIIRADSSHRLLAAAMADAIPAHSDEFAIRHGEQMASMVEIIQVSGKMWNQLTDPVHPMLVEPKHLRLVNRKIREMAAAADVDLDEVES